jgi:hypothetical protein
MGNSHSASAPGAQAVEDNIHVHLSSGAGREVDMIRFREFALAAATHTPGRASAPA